LLQPEEDYDSEEDEDFQPESDEEIDEQVAAEDDADALDIGGKKRKRSKKDSSGKISRRGRARLHGKPDESATTTSTPAVSEGPAKVNEPPKDTSVDALWEEMKKTSSAPATNNSSAPSSNENVQLLSKPPAPPKPDVVQVTETYKFAGEVVKVTKSVPATEAKAAAAAIGKPKSNLDDLLNSLGKKKISTLEKSKLDWQNFKSKEGIEEELKEKTKDGYLERQAFLARTDYRQFEQERDIRLKRIMANKQQQQ